MPDPATEHAVARLMATEERVLYQLAACEYCVDNGEVRVGPPGTSWKDLLDAVTEGFKHGWVAYAEMGCAGGRHMTWRPTRLGEREIDAFMRRYPDAFKEDV
jgi:hypothetical protein